MKPLAKLLSGSVVAQGVTMLSYLLLTRIYSPDDFGAFNIFYSYIELLIILSTLKYELAPVAADSDREATAIARFSLRLNFFVSIALLVVFLMLNLFGWLPGKLPDVGWTTMLIPFMVFFTGASRIYASLFNRAKQFGQIVWSDLSISIGGALSKIVMGLASLTRGIGLPLGTVLGAASGNVNYLANLHKLGLPRDIGASERKASAKKFRKFPLFTASRDFIDTLSANLPFLWLPVAMSVGDAEIGLFGLALTFSFRPVNVFNTAAERVLYVDISDNLRERKPIAPTIKRFVLLLGAVSLPVFVLLWFFAEPVFGFVFGSKWTGSAPYFHALLPWMWVLLLTNSLLSIPYALSKQQGEFVFSLIQLALRVSALAIGVAHGDFLLAVWLYALASMLVVIARLLWFALLVRHYETDIKNNKTGI
mgnify:FL=1